MEWLATAITMIKPLLQTWNTNAIGTYKRTPRQQHCMLVMHYWNSLFGAEPNVCFYDVGIVIYIFCITHPVHLHAPSLYSTAPLLLLPCLVLCVSEHLSMATYLGSLIHMYKYKLERKAIIRAKYATGRVKTQDGLILKVFVSRGDSLADEDLWSRNVLGFYSSCCVFCSYNWFPFICWCNNEPLQHQV